NLSKYPRAQPKNHAASHLGYIEKITDRVHDFYREHYKRSPSEAVLRFLNREVIQAIWSKILNPKVVKAYLDGVQFQCADKVLRRFLVQVMCLKFLGHCLCVRCTIEKYRVAMMGD
ncbi:hypothetical protein MPER_07345, partial [Moniliophthora perniciosa FA553]